MKFTEHPETLEVELGQSYRGGLFAMPVLLHPQLLASSGDPLATVDTEAIGKALQLTGVISNEGQDATFLSRVVDASFVCSSRGEMQKPMMKALIAMHRSLPSWKKHAEIFKLSGYDHASGGLVFLLGVVYRRSTDPRPVFLPDPQSFLFSQERFALERALGGAVPSMYRHQILAPFTLSKAIGEGLSAAVECWSGMHEEQLHCEFDLTSDGDVTMALRDSQATAVSLKFENDAISPEDLAMIQNRVASTAAFTAPITSYFRH